MNQDIKFFKVGYASGVFLSFALPALLSSAKRSGITLTLTDAESNIERSLPTVQEMYEVIIKNTPIMLLVTKDKLKAKLEISVSSIKLYPELPFQMKLHRDEEVPSVDYVAYLELLLALCKDFEIDALGTKEDLYDY